MIIDKNAVSEKDEIYEYPSILREYNDGLLLQKTMVSGIVSTS